MRRAPKPIKPHIRPITRPAVDLNKGPRGQRVLLHATPVGDELNLIRDFLRDGILSPSYARQQKGKGKKVGRAGFARHRSDYSIDDLVYLFKGASYGFSSFKPKPHALAWIGLLYGDVGFLVHPRAVKRQPRSVTISAEHPGLIKPESIVGIVVDKTHDVPRRLKKLTALCREYHLPLYLYTGKTRRDPTRLQSFAEYPIQLVYDPFVEKQALRTKLVRILHHRQTKK